MRRRGGPGLGRAAAVALAAGLGAYFAYAAVQGDHGLFARVRVEARTAELAAELAALEAEVAARANLVRRLSDDFLDIDLLDERARAVLGYVGEGEVVLR